MQTTNIYSRLTVPDLQSKKFGVQVLSIWQNVHNLKPSIWIILQIPQYMICSNPLCIKDRTNHKQKLNSIKDVLETKF